MTVCPDHPDEGPCPTCESRFAARVSYACAVCGYAEAMPLWGRALVHETLFRFAYDRGVNLNRPSVRDFKLTRDIEERVRSVEPPSVAYTFFIDSDTLAVTVDGSLAMTVEGEPVGNN